MSPGRELPRRLRAVAAMVPWSSRVADVGTDHGLLPWLLVESGRAVHCVAIDRSPAALRGFPRPPADHPLASRLEVRRGDGLAVLRADDHVDVAVLAGLGARSVVRILDRCPHEHTPERLVLEPRAEAWRVRRWLRDRGYGVVAERVVYERGRFYEIVAAACEGPAASWRVAGLTDADVLEAGPSIVRSGSALARRWWRRRLAHQRELLRVTPASRERLGPTRRRLERAHRVLEALERHGRSRGTRRPAPGTRPDALL